MMEDSETTHIRSIVNSMLGPINNQLVSALIDLEKKVDELEKSIPKWNADTKVTKQYAYQLYGNGTDGNTYMLGYFNLPEDLNRASFLDKQICAGFYGDLQMVKLIVNLLNRHERGLL
jgi:hypothetical protein